MGTSKAKMAPASAQEIALGEIGKDVYADYELNQQPQNKAFLGMASTDRSLQAAGRSTVDAQMASGSALANAIARGNSSGGLGSNASAAMIDAGATGGAVANAGAAGFGAGRVSSAQNLVGAVNAVQSGQDTTIGGMRTAANIASGSALDEYNTGQALTNIRNSGIAQTLGAVGSGYFKGKQLAALNPPLAEANPNYAGFQNHPLYSTSGPISLVNDRLQNTNLQQKSSQPRSTGMEGRR